MPSIFSAEFVFFFLLPLSSLTSLYSIYICIFEWKAKQSFAGVRTGNKKDTYWLKNGSRRAHLEYHCELGFLALFQIGCICASSSSITFSTKN